MRQVEAQKHIFQASQALERGDWEAGQREAERAMFFDNSVALAFTLQGIALAKQGKDESAEAALRKAVMLEPLQPRNAYNLAVLLFARGDRREAFRIAEESLKDDPNYEQAKVLIDRINDPDYDGGAEFDLPEVGRPLYEIIDPERKHSIPFMTGMEGPWTAIGWIFFGIALVAGIMMFVVQPITPPEEGSKLMSFKPGLASMISVFLLLISGVFSIFWVLLDVVDRKTKLVWLVPVVALCTCGMHALPHGLYMLMRRALQP